MRVSVVFDLDDHPNAFLGGFVPNIPDANHDFLVDEIGDLDQHVGLLDLVGDFVHHDPFSMLIIEYVAFRTNMETALSGCVHVGDAVDAVDGRTGREIRALNVFHVLFYSDVWPAFGTALKDGIDVKVHGTRNLGEVVRRDAGGHTDRNPVASVQQQVGKPCRKHRRFVFRIIKVRLEINRVFVDVLKHVLCNPIEPTFRVSHGCRWVAVDGAKVPLAVNQRIAKGEFLGHSNHGVVDGLVAVRVVFPHHFSNGAGRFAELLVRGVAALEHAVENATVNRFETVPCIGQSAPDDDRHGVVDVGIFHLGVQRMVEDGFPRGGGFGVAVVGFVLRCQGWSPPWHGVQ